MRKPIVLATLLLFTCLACGTVRKLEMQSITALRILRVAGDTADIEIEGIVRNPSRFGGRIRDFNYVISIAGSSFAKGSCPGPLDLPGRSEVIVRLPLTIQLKRLTDQAKAELFRDECHYRLLGSATVDEPMRRTVRMDAEGVIRGPGRLSVTLYPEVGHRLVSLDRVDLKGVHLTALDTVFLLKIRNPFPFALNIEELSYQLKSGGRLIGQGSTPKTMILESGITLSRVPVSFRTSNLLAGLLESVPSFQVPDLTVSGRAVVEHNGRRLELIFETLDEKTAHSGLDLQN